MNNQIKILNEVLLEIDKRSKDKQFVVKSLKTPSRIATYYYKGTLNGLDIAKQVIKEKLKDI